MFTFIILNLVCKIIFLLLLLNKANKPIDINISNLIYKKIQH